MTHRLRLLRPQAGPETVLGHHKIYIQKSGFVAILIVTSMDFGGLTEILKISNDGGRFPNQFEFDPRYRQGFTDCSITELYPARIQYLWIFQPFDHWYRHTFWSVIFGNSTGFAVASYTCQQYKVQRYLSCKSLKEAQKCIYMAAVGIMAICVAGKCAWRPWNETFLSGILIELWIQVNWLDTVALRIFNIVILGKMVGSQLEIKLYPIYHCTCLVK